MAAIDYELLHQDTTSKARLGRVTTPHGVFDTPAFMPVGTQGTIKGLLPAMVAGTGAQIVLGNTYHLLLRPGSELIAKMGGLQSWTGWGGPMLTDSGGFQVFSLGKLNRINDDGVTFRSHIDGATVELTPERSMLVQEQLGADIIMAFDDCPPAPSEGDEDGGLRGPAYAKRIEVANERTLRWLERCVAAHRGSGRWEEQALFGIVQGGTDLEARTRCAQAVMEHDLPGYAVGGVAVGEGFAEIKKVVEHTAPLLPSDRPRYLMGVGYERDIVTAVRAGVDMFDCVLPTRNGRNASAFTSTGLIRLKNAQYAEDAGPIESGCDCVACRGGGGSGRVEGEAGFSRSYLRHLFQAGEMLGPILVSLHNLRHFQRLLLDIRGAIRDNDWSGFARRWPVAFDR